MKFNIILATICLALGATIAWVAKPDPTSTAPQVENETDKPSKAQAAPSSSDDKREISERKIVESGNALESTIIPFGEEGDNPEGNRMQDRMSQMFKKRQMAKLDARIAKLVNQLNLTPAQEAALRKAAEEKMEGLGDLFSGNGDRSNLANMMKGDGIDEALADILTPGQLEEHEEVKKRELANKVEAKALKNLAKLSNLDLSQEQKDAAYDILYKQAEGSVTDDSGAGGMFSMITDGLGIEIDGDAIGLAANLIPNAEDMENGDVERPDPQAMMAKMKENQAKQIDDKVKALSPVLNDSQLEQYRKDLELKSGGIFGGFMGDFNRDGE